MILRCFWLLASLLSLVLADVEFTGPVGGDSISGLTIDLEWQDSGKTPKISELVTYQMFLMAGGNDVSSYQQLGVLVQNGNYAKGNKVSVTIQAGWGADVENAYFVKVMSAATGGVIINFSDRFSLTSMTGTFSPAVVAGLKTVSGTAGPATIDQITSPQNGPAGDVGSAPAGAFGTPYTLQTGQVRYAPMPPMAQTKITAKNKSPQFPTSAYTVYQTNMGPPNAITTQTQPLTFSPIMREATVAAAPNPTDTAMARFLNRWRD